MGKFNLEDYEPVQSRLPKFFLKYPDGRVITDLKSPVDNLDTVVFQASLYNGETLLSTGWAFEAQDKELKKTRSGGEYESVNYTSHLENCETSAIGRALANITIHGDKRPSREEMEKVRRGEKQPETTDLITLDQCTEIQDEIKNRQGIDVPKMLDWCTKAWGYPVKEIADIREKNMKAVMTIIQKKPLKV